MVDGCGEVAESLETEVIGGRFCFWLFPTSLPPSSPGVTVFLCRADVSTVTEGVSVHPSPPLTS